MQPRQQSETGQSDLFRARLDQILNLDHELVRLARLIDWRFVETQCGAAYSDIAGQPPLPTRLMAGLAILRAGRRHSRQIELAQLDHASRGDWIE